ncbi:FAD-dependent oxidoreductase [Nocardia puris]|uniref:Putative flavoprotein involved in K+ transport n=1 Tax=Nocardia puris TaxID=208602 RepID=A0A366D0K9_9NOCA|nr:NAD(P)/FAD-dependent oxidoreductase [Nocardia puris]MBF6215159.1 FAD-dependent oxidoreductase [Nocardia puris]MBF6369670.1 FAD-dependent oxidoreductase [Nocardia puris]RBO83602.1 putative flavoprotein involved in K+ transport [Nocardia puris]
MNDLPKTVDTVIVGAGKAGLATAYHLQRAGADFVVLDAADQLGEPWRTRWDSMTLFTSARFSALPGAAFPGDPHRYPHKDEVADYLEQYADRFRLPVLLGRRVDSLRKVDGEFLLSLGGETCAARKVVVATGAFQQPWVPPVAAELDHGIVALHSHEYRNPGQVRPGTVLVVGGGNSGTQIADELSATHRVVLSRGAPLPSIPQQVLGRDVWTFLRPLLRLPVVGPLRKPDPVIGAPADLLSRVQPVGRIESVDGAALVTADGTRIEPDTVIWATGYRDDWSWFDRSLLGEDGKPAHVAGIGAVPGLYFVGLYRLRSRGSALLGFGGRDAARIAEAVLR